MIDNIILGIVLILFPLICYTIYISEYGEDKKKYKDLFLDLALFTAIFLYIKYSVNITEQTIILVNIPFLIAIIKNRKLTMLISSILIISAYYYFFDYNLIYLISEYMLYYLLSVVDFGNKSIFKIVLGFSIIKMLVSYLYTGQIYFYGSILLFSLGLFILYLFNIGESIMDLNINIKKLKKEKVINDSIFKITHEIKNPIAVCKGYLDMFDPSDVDKSTRYVEILKEEINRTLELLKDFLNFSKIEIKKEEMDIEMLLEDTYEGFKNYVLASGINISFDGVDDEVYIYGDYKRLKQVFLNLIKNSMEAIKEKKINDGLIRISCKNNNDYFNITLEDNGIGIDNNTLKDMYKPFYTTKQDGTGLGVCFSKEVIDSHLGSIKYYTEYGKWTRVIINLPIKNND